MHVYIVYIYTHTDTQIYIYIYIYMYYIYVRNTFVLKDFQRTGCNQHTCMYVHMHAGMGIWNRVYIHITESYTYIHMYIHIHT